MKHGNTFSSRSSSPMQRLVRILLLNVVLLQSFVTLAIGQIAEKIFTIQL